MLVAHLGLITAPKTYYIVYWQHSHWLIMREILMRQPSTCCSIKLKSLLNRCTLHYYAYILLQPFTGTRYIPVYHAFLLRPTLYPRSTLYPSWQLRLQRPLHFPARRELSTGVHAISAPMYSWVSLVDEWGWILINQSNVPWGWPIKSDLALSQLLWGL